MAAYVGTQPTSASEEPALSRARHRAPGPARPGLFFLAGFVCTTALALPFLLLDRSAVPDGDRPGIPTVAPSAPSGPEISTATRSSAGEGAADPEPGVAADPSAPVPPAGTQPGDGAGSTGAAVGAALPTGAGPVQGDEPAVGRPATPDPAAPDPAAPDPAATHPSASHPAATHPSAPGPAAPDPGEQPPAADDGGSGGPLSCDLLPRPVECLGETVDDAGTAVGGAVGGLTG
ncbi:MAG TPA: hypothetical protein VHF92_08015 [Geodermatophilus sp.]|nr:hypothetical protein [Geodermatophilus sp.]